MAAKGNSSNRPAKGLATTPSRRDEHKSRTRRALQQAALELFAEQGYDTTTTEEIAERAGVSPRTFFRYFATKESALFVGEYGWFQSLTDVYLAQPASLRDLDALRESLVVLAPGWVRIRRSLLLYQRAVQSSPTLRGRVQDHQHALRTTLAEAIGTRRGLDAPDEGCALLAAVVMLTYRRALDVWLAGPASADTGDTVANEFGLLADLVASSEQQRPRRASAR